MLRETKNQLILTAFFENHQNILTKLPLFHKGHNNPIANGIKKLHKG